MKPKNKAFSLRLGLLGIVVGCWVLPVALILASLTYYTTQGVRRQFNETVRASISDAAAATRRAIRDSVSASRNASYDGTIRTAYQRYLEDGDAQSLFESVDLFLRQNYQYDDNFLTTALFFYESPYEIYHTFNPRLGSSYSRVLAYTENTHDAILKRCKTLDTKIAFVTSGENLYMVRNLVDADFTPFAALVMELNRDAIVGSFKNIVWKTAATVYLEGVALDVVNPESPSPLLLPEGIALSPSEQLVEEHAAAIRVYGRENTDSADIHYAVELDAQGYIRGFFSFINIAVFMLVLSIPLIVLAVWFFYHNIFGPISRLVSAAGEIQEGKLGNFVEGDVNNREFKYLNSAFNDMSVRLKQQFERIYSEELALRDARIKALQSQINPHFLNNTLEIINWEVRLGNNERVSKMIEALSTMLDAAMSRRASTLVTLNEEMAYVDAYLYIISERFGKRLTVKKDIDENLLACKVPRLITQPIIENAVEHGADKMQMGVVEIIAKNNEDGTMTIRVSNNSPMSEEDKAVVAKLLDPDYDPKETGSLHLGIYNVNQRLKMIYGENFGLEITNDDKETVSQFTAPMIMSEVET